MASRFLRSALRHIQKRSYNEVKWTRFPLKFEYQHQGTNLTRLPSGLRVATHYIPGPTATVGFFVDSGSRAETLENNGVAHFFEHMAFKGTSNMSQQQMEECVENLGARLFAYTSREQTVYYGKCFNQDIPTILGILSDIIQRPLLSEQAIENERNVILREMEDIETQMDEVIFDHLHSTAYQGSPLGFTILGPSENVRRISKNDLQNYIARHYTAGRIMLTAVGNVNHDSVVELASRQLSELPQTNDSDLISWYEPAKYLGSMVSSRNDDMPYAHVTWGYEAVPPTHPDFVPLMIASTLIGSFDQSLTNGKVTPSHLAQLVSEADCCRSFTNFYAPYKDTALWGIYFVAKNQNLEYLTKCIGNFFFDLQNKISEGSVERAKNHLKTNYLMQLDGTTPLFEEIGRQIFTYGYCIPQEDFEAEIDRCTPSLIQTAVTNMMTGRCPAVAAIGLSLYHIRSHCLPS